MHSSGRYRRTAAPLTSRSATVAASHVGGKSKRSAAVEAGLSPSTAAEAKEDAPEQAAVEAADYWTPAQLEPEGARNAVIQRPSFVGCKALIVTRHRQRRRRPLPLDPAHLDPADDVGFKDVWSLRKSMFIFRHPGVKAPMTPRDADSDCWTPSQLGPCSGICVRRQT